MKNNSSYHMENIQYEDPELDSLVLAAHIGYGVMIETVCHPIRCAKALVKTAESKPGERMATYMDNFLFADA